MIKARCFSCGVKLEVESLEFGERVFCPKHFNSSVLATGRYMEKRICDDALKAMPGDIITYEDPETGISVSGVVRSAGWQPYAKGGKVWTYETTNGVMVSNERVTKLEKKLTNPVHQAESSPALQSVTNPTIPTNNLEFRKSQNHHFVLSRIERAPFISHATATILACVLDDDLEGLSIAAGLISRRMRELENLSVLESNS